MTNSRRFISGISRAFSPAFYEPPAALSIRYNTAVSRPDIAKPILPHPQEPGASPSPIHGDDVTWWTPSWQDIARHIGWRWVLLIPIIAVMVLLIAAVFDGRFVTLFWILGPKPVILMLAIPVVALGAVMRKAVETRKEPFCIHCGYALTGLPDHYRCPECGRPYTLAIINEYRRNPKWFIERYKATGRLPEADQPFAAGARMRPPSRDGT
jgi:hypothetical protein